MSHAVQHHLCVLETFTVTVLEDEDPQRKPWTKREEGLLQGCCSGLWVGVYLCTSVHKHAQQCSVVCYRFGIAQLWEQIFCTSSHLVWMAEGHSTAAPSGESPWSSAEP